MLRIEMEYKIHNVKAQKYEKYSKKLKSVQEIETSLSHISLKLFALHIFYARTPRDLQQ